MADTNRRVTFTGVDNGVESMMQRLRASAEQTTRQLIRDARQYSSSGTEVIRYIEDEIRAIEKRNQVYASAQRLELEQRRNAALGQATTPEQQQNIQQQFREKASQLTLELKEDKLQLDLMRELIDTVRNSAREEISEDRRNVEEQIDRNEGLAQRGIADDADELNELRQTIQRQEIGTEAEASAAENAAYKRSKVADRTERAISKGAQVASMDNEIYMAAGLAAMIPIVGQGISMLMQKYMQKGEELDVATGRAYALTGKQVGATFNASTGDMVTQGWGYGTSSQYGATQAEFLQSYVVPMARAMGGNRITEREAMFALEAEKGLGIDVGAQASIAKVGRYDTRFGSNEARIQSLISAFAASGVVSSGDTSLIPDLLEMQVSLAREQVARLGKVDMGINQGIAGSLAAMSDTFRSPESLSAALGALDTGLRSPANSYAQAAQFAVLRQQNPGASRWELLKMQEQGFQDKGQLTGIISRLAQASGSNDQLFFEQIKAFFPQLSYKQAEELGQGYRAKGESFLSQVQAGGGGIGAAGRAATATGVMQRQTAKLDDDFATMGLKMNMYIENKIEDFGAVMDAFKGGLMDGLGALGTFTAGLGDFSNKLPQKNKVHK